MGFIRQWGIRWWGLSRSPFAASDRCGAGYSESTPWTFRFAYIIILRIFVQKVGLGYRTSISMNPAPIENLTGSTSDCFNQTISPMKYGTGITDGVGKECMAFDAVAFAESEGTWQLFEFTRLSRPLIRKRRNMLHETKCGII